MEYMNLGAFPEGEWDSLTKMFVSEDLDFMSPQFLSPFFPDIDGSESLSLFQTLDSMNSDLQYLSQESSHSTSTNSGTGGTHETYNYFAADNAACIASEPSFLASVDTAFGGENITGLKRPLYDSADDDKANVVSNPKKKPRVSNARKNKRNGKAEEEISHVSNSSSEDDNGADATSDEKAVTPNGGKARASRGSATDPQSLYARKRRERINERLRILQNIVPNGTKVDISTMLEEAVHYVKFLQLQIKLLSSDDMWMYAPLAYNGMDLGLNQKLSQLV